MSVAHVFVTKDGPNGFANLPAIPVIVEDNEKTKKVWIKDMQSHMMAVIRDFTDRSFAVMYNQRLRGVIMINCKNCQLQVLDSAVLVTQQCTFINCDNCEFVFEDVDVRRIELYGVTNSRVVIVSSPPLTELANVFWRQGCRSNVMQLAQMLDHRLFFGIPFKVTSTLEIPDPEGANQVVSYVDISEQMRYEISSLNVHETVDQPLRELAEMENRTFPYSRADLDEAYAQEKQEFYDSEEELRGKVKQIAAVLKKAKHAVCYTGAGVSTSANIPDFRGPTGVWTNKETGKQTKSVDMVTVRPTYGHYAITHLMRLNIIKFLITSNVDGLHLRSGVLPHLLVEAHGNLYKEVCEKCGKSFLRDYSVEHIGQHLTGWHCTWCNNRLRDTHVAFGENVNEHDLSVSLFQARKADVSFILGTSMNVQPSVAFQILPKKRSGKVILVNLQKTPYDSVIDYRVFAKTDDFLRLLMSELAVPEFDRSTDLLSIWDTYPEMLEEQRTLKEKGATSLPISKKVRAKSFLPKRAAERGVLVGLGIAIGYLGFYFLSKRK